MKKILSLMMILTMGFTFSACGDNHSLQEEASEDSSTAEVSQEDGSAVAVSQEEDSTAAEESTDASENTSQTGENVPTTGGSSVLVAYFSWSGNTESVAKEIQAQTGADIFRIVPAEPYTDDYDTLLDIAQEEQAVDARPEIADTVEDFQQYDVVYLGYPNWWGDMPMVLYTFLDEYDFSGKTIAPFVTSGGSGFSGTIGTIESMEPNAAVTEGLSLGSSEAAEPADAVSSWLAANGISNN